MIDRIALAVSSEVYVLRGIAKGKPDESSMEVSMYLFLSLESGRGPTMSTANFSPLCEIISASTIGSLGPLDLV